jgi:creatinine amidohydrolase
MTFLIEEMTMKEWQDQVDGDTIVLVPVGILEGHGGHLPLSTDTYQAVHVCHSLAEELDNVLVAPTVHYGQCSSTANFPGSISISFDTVRALLRDILSEFYRQGVRNIVVISGHAGRNHIAAISEAARGVVADHPDYRIMTLSDFDLAYERLGKEFPAQDGHGGAVETSRVWAIRPELVRGQPEATTPEMPRWAHLPNPEEVWTEGHWGDPTEASPEKGRDLNDWIVGQLKGHLEKMRTGWS